MPSDLLVSLFGRGTLVEVQPSENGVFAVSLLDFQLRLLDATLLGESRFLPVDGLVVGEEVELFGRRGQREAVLVDDVAGRQVEPSYQQISVHDALVELYDGVSDELRRGRVPFERGRAVGVFRHLSPVVVGGDFTVVFRADFRQS